MSVQYYAINTMCNKYTDYCADLHSPLPHTRTRESENTLSTLKKHFKKRKTPNSHN